MMIYRRKKQDFKGLQSSDIVPILRLTKAQPIETQEVLKTRNVEKL